MVKVETAPYDEAKHSCNADENCATPALSDYPRADVVTTATADFVERGNRKLPN